MLSWHANKDYCRLDNGLRNKRGDFAALIDGVPTEQLKANRALLQKFMSIVERHTGGNPKGQELAKWSLRNDKRFFSDPEAVWKLIEHQQAVEGQWP